jgi:AraC family transcriptional regulator
MTAVCQPRIEVLESGRRIPVTRDVPVLSGFVSMDKDVVLERYVIPHAGDYPQREFPTLVIFLCQSEPVRVAGQIAEKQFDAETHPGHVWIVPRGARHAARFEGKHGGILLSIGNEQFERHVDRIAHGRRIELVPTFDVKDVQLEHLLLGLLTVAQEGSCADALIGDLLVNAICIRLVERYARSTPRVALQRGGLPAARLRRVLEFIDMNLDKNLSLSALADTAQMNLYYFATLFRKSVGVSPHQYVLDRRVDRGKQLLGGDRKLSVLDVGLQVGFEHPNSFARAFRRRAGVSPVEFRRDCLGLRKKSQELFQTPRSAEQLDWRRR